MCEDHVPSTPPVGPHLHLPELSPEEVHKNILRCHALKSRVTVKLLRWLNVLVEQGYAHQLGASNPVQYVMENLDYLRGEAYQTVKVAAAFKRLPKCIEAFGRSRISWCKMKQIARIARTKTEEEWLAFALKHKADDLVIEVNDARASGRKLPRKNRRGLPCDGTPSPPA